MIDALSCAGGNAALTRSAFERGMLLGVRSDRPSHGVSMRFVESDYRRPPQCEALLRPVARFQPRFLVVRDLSANTVDEADIGCAGTRLLSDHCEVPLVVLKLGGRRSLQPADLSVGSSVPTTHGAPCWATNRASRRSRTATSAPAPRSLRSMGTWPGARGRGRRGTG